MFMVPNADLARSSSDRASADVATPNRMLRLVQQRHGLLPLRATGYRRTHGEGEIHVTRTAVSMPRQSSQCPVGHGFAKRITCAGTADGQCRIRAGLLSRDPAAMISASQP